MVADATSSIFAVPETSPKQLDRFILFPQLPIEPRLKIWQSSFVARGQPDLKGDYRVGNVVALS
jgi:hypothetical protein